MRPAPDAHLANLAGDRREDAGHVLGVDAGDLLVVPIGQRVARLAAEYTMSVPPGSRGPGPRVTFAVLKSLLNEVLGVATA